MLFEVALIIVLLAYPAIMILVYRAGYAAGSSGKKRPSVFGLDSVEVVAPDAAGASEPDIDYNALLRNIERYQGDGAGQEDV